MTYLYLVSFSKTKMQFAIEKANPLENAKTQVTSLSASKCRLLDDIVDTAPGWLQNKQFSLI